MFQTVIWISNKNNPISEIPQDYKKKNENCFSSRWSQAFLSAFNLQFFIHQIFSPYILFTKYSPSLHAIYLHSTAMRSPVWNEPPVFSILNSFQLSADIISCIRNNCFPCVVGVNKICVILVYVNFLSASN